MKPKIKKKFLLKNTLSKKIVNFENSIQLSPLSNIKKAFKNVFIKKNINSASFLSLNDSLKHNRKSIWHNKSIKEKNNLYLHMRKSETFNANDTTKIFNRKSRTIIIKKFKKIIKKPKTKPLNFNINPVRNRSIFEKIIDNIDKIKKKTNTTLNIIKKNAKISDKEITNRSYKLRYIDKILKNSKENSHKNILENKIKEPAKYDLNNFKDSNNILLDEINYKYSPKIDFPKSKDKKNGNKTERLGIIKIPSISLNSIKKKNRFYDKNDRMFHIRNLKISEENLEKKFENLNNVKKLNGKKSYIKETKLQLKDILNKINLILDNIEYFKSNYMYKGIFYSAFDNMENSQKAKFNLILEEICVLLIKIVPKLLKNFYDNLDKLLYVDIPDIDLEIEKEPENEEKCLNLNYSFFNKVTFYFFACVEILKEIEKRIEFFKFSCSEYTLINNYLNLIRFDTTKINSIARNHIVKTTKDMEILEKFEIGLGIKSKKLQNEEDILERYRKRHNQQKIFDDMLKKERINSTLNFNIRSFKMKKIVGRKGNKYIYERRNFKSLLNNPLVIKMMKYFKNNVKSQIISQQVIERYKEKE